MLRGEQRLLCGTELRLHVLQIGIRAGSAPLQCRQLKIRRMYMRHTTQREKTISHTSIATAEAQAVNARSGVARTACCFSSTSRRRLRTTLSRSRNSLPCCQHHIQHTKESDMLVSIRTHEQRECAFPSSHAPFAALRVLAILTFSVCCLSAACCAVSSRFCCSSSRHFRSTISEV